jgi:D-threo-aldose 1-dehydrogenase
VKERRRLGTSSVEVTPLGFGAAALGNLYAAVPDRDASGAVEAALVEGVRYFDTAPYYGYGLSERRLGEVLRRFSGDDVVVSTKVGRLLEPRGGPPRSDQGFVDALPFDASFDYSYDGVMRSVEESLGRLGRDQIDVLLMHDLGESTHGAAHETVFKTALNDGYRALDELRRAGDVGAIGLGVNECAVCLQAMDQGDFDCFLVAGRYTLLDQSAADELLPACRVRGVSVVVGGPFNSGILASHLETGATYNYGAASDEILERARAIDRVCRAHGVPLAAAALQFPLSHQMVAAVIPGARSAAEVHANARAFEHPIPGALWDDLLEAGLLRRAASP